MEKIWNNFDEESKKIVRELTGYRKKKFTNLVNELNTSKNNMNEEPKLIETLVQDIKK